MYIRKYWKGLTIFLMISSFIMCKPHLSSHSQSGQQLTGHINDTGSLKNAASFPVGVSVNPHLLTSDPGYAATIIKEFNSITPENAMKWEKIHPDYNRYDFTDADSLVAFATAHQMRIHGHNLVWYQGNPQWLEDFKTDEKGWEKLLKDHIETVVNHYKGKVASWDVVNEAFDQDGNYRSNNVWGRHLGNQYIQKAFMLAHNADPNARLFYNDYGQEDNPGKHRAILKMVSELKAAGVPLNGLGIQMHINVNSNEDKIVQVLKDYAATGLLIHISELDIALNTKNNSSLTYTKELEQKQAAKYRFIVNAYRKYIPTAQQYGITTWDVGDKDTWIRRFFNKNDWPLLFDDRYKKKLSYYSFLEALRNKPE